MLRAILNAEDFKVENQWSFWIFPTVENSFENARITDRLSADDIMYMQCGGGVMLVDNFPGETLTETFRPHTSGRCLGHSGALINPHPVWKSFPHDNFADWQFYQMMTGSKSLVRDDEMPNSNALLELIPSFKLIKHKSLLSEYRVGSGRLIICGLNFQPDTPAARYLRYSILRYLNKRDYVSAPEWDSGDLMQRVSKFGGKIKKLGKKIDEGGRPVDE